MRHVIWIAGLALASAACVQNAPEDVSSASTTQPVESTPPAPASVDHQTLAFAQAACGGCHAVEANDLSPVPDVPRWIDIANRPGLSEVTLANWLRDAHNYPEMMDFDLDGDQVDMIASYMLTLRSTDYKRAPD